MFEIPDQFDGSLEVSTFKAFLRTQGMIPWAWQLHSETPSRATLLAPGLGRQQGAWARSAESSSCSRRGASFQLHLDGIPLFRLFRSAASAIRCRCSLVKPACLPGAAQPSALEISYRNGLHEKKSPPPKKKPVSDGPPAAQRSTPVSRDLGLCSGVTTVTLADTHPALLSLHSPIPAFLPLLESEALGLICGSMHLH